MQDLRWIASPSARNDGGAARNDGGAARNDGGAARNDGGWLAMKPDPCHCEERSDVAIHISGSVGLKMDCFAYGSQ